MSSRPETTSRLADDADTMQRLERWLRHAFRPARASLTFAFEVSSPDPHSQTPHTVIEVLFDGLPRWQHVLSKAAAQVSWADVVHAANLYDRAHHRREMGPARGRV